MASERFQPGFRISVWDVVILCAGAAGSVWLWSETTWATGFLVAFVVLHFFLFCNVFRIARLPELIWAATLLLLVGAHKVPSGSDDALVLVFGFSFVLAVVLIWMETRKPSYHGIFWEHLNPGLRTWRETNDRNEE